MPPLQAKLRLSISHRERLRNCTGELDKCDCALKHLGILRSAFLYVVAAGQVDIALKDSSCRSLRHADRLPQSRLLRKEWIAIFGLQLHKLYSPFEFTGILACHCLIPSHKIGINKKCA